MSPQFRAIRSKARNPMDTCFWCRHKFEDGELMALACFEEKKGNKVLCQDCADELLASDGTAAANTEAAERSVGDADLR